ncbi:Sporulation domain-containing protein [Thermodesulfatator indicus DSM 15286]|uniref:Sporulation domain-containing protein n=1 Tax=Thermodesulfatator indicus (strain DSM 15286 / JCM 11887 / CIR29812) TaxID=667014 RepID=F8ACI3_THEID|nr:SPOR domain-containing protein [Thermodesulfatator indicus]AEH44686.1 Sporulation domain-containing protein [Thermodesulfatator indicus DSM 15286]
MAKKTPKKKRFQFQLGWPGLIFSFGLLICLFLWMFVLGFYFGQKMVSTKVHSLGSPVSQKALSSKKNIEPPPVFEEVKPPPLVKEPTSQAQNAVTQKPEKVEPATPVLPESEKATKQPKALQESSKVARPQKVVPPKKEKPKSFYAVQVASLRSQADAEKYASYLRDRGYEVTIKKVTLPQKGTWYRVYVGRFATLAEAKAFGEQIKAREKLKSFYVQRISN